MTTPTQPGDLTPEQIQAILDEREARNRAKHGERYGAKAEFWEWSRRQPVRDWRGDFTNTKPK